MEVRVLLLVVKMSRAPQTVSDPQTRLCNPDKIRSWGRILLDSGDGSGSKKLVGSGTG